MSNKVVAFNHHIGIRAYAIQDDNTHLYFAWCYTSEHFANEMAGKISINSVMDQQVNWRANKSMLGISDRTAFDRKGDL